MFTSFQKAKLKLQCVSCMNGYEWIKHGLNVHSKDLHHNVSYEKQFGFLSLEDNTYIRQ